MSDQIGQNIEEELATMLVIIQAQGVKISDLISRVTELENKDKPKKDGYMARKINTGPLR